MESLRKHLTTHQQGIKIMSQGRKITQEIKDQMIKMYNEGNSGEVIGAKFGSKPQTVTKIVIAAGIEIRGPKQKLTEENKKEIIRIHKEDNIGSYKLGKKFGVSAMVIHKLIKDNENPKEPFDKNAKVIKHVISDEEKEKMIKRYLEGAGTTTIAEEFNCLVKTVTKVLKNANIELRGPEKKLDEEQEKNMLDSYNDGLKTNEELAIEFNVSEATVSRTLLKQGTRRAKTSEHRAEYKVVENYFDVIDTEEKAYYLGWIAADGNIDKETKSTLALGINSDDRELLERFANSVLIGTPLNHISDFLVKSEKYPDKTYKQSRLSISNKNFISGLMKHGVGPVKSFTLEFPELNSEELYRAYIRGFSDGDGSIYFKKEKYAIFHSMISSDIFIEEYAKYIEKILEINIYIKKVKSSSGISVGLICGNKQTRKFLDWLYKDSNIYLNRKYIRYLQAIKISDYSGTLRSLGYNFNGFMPDKIPCEKLMENTNKEIIENYHIINTFLKIKNENLIDKINYENLSDEGDNNIKEFDNVNEDDNLKKVLKAIKDAKSK